MTKTYGPKVINRGAAKRPRRRGIRAPKFWDLEDEDGCSFSVLEGVGGTCTPGGTALREAVEESYAQTIICERHLLATFIEVQSMVRRL